MEKNKQMKTIKHIALFITFSILAITGCKKDKTPEPELTKPSLSDIEIGLGNNEIGVIGRDFHLNAEVLAGDKIESVQIKIVQRSGETYSKIWSHEITWSEFKGAKNATVHKHFTIPTDAAEGKYDFLIIVKDQNGTTLEEKKTISLILPENLPVDPTIGTIAIVNRDNGNTIYDHGLGGFYDPATGNYGNGSNVLNNNEKISYAISLGGIKGDGTAYIVLINKKHNHKPEDINSIDFSKAIVWSVFEHKNKTEVGSFTNTYVDRKQTPPLVVPSLIIGTATQDNNTPSPSPINGLKAWETGNYYLGVIYHNATHNVNFFNYLEVSVKL